MVVSDLVDQTDSLALGIGQISFRKQDLALFHIEDPAERDFPFSGQTIFVGSEQEGRLVCEPRDLRRAYLSARRRHLQAIRDICMQFRYDVEDLSTDARLDETLSRFLAVRLARRRRG